MQGSIKLSLLMGPVPVPVPSFVIEVTEHGESASWARAIRRAASSSTSMCPCARSCTRCFSVLGTVAAGGLPFMRVVLVATVNGNAESIIDGVATDIEAQPADGGNAKLIVKGKDLSALMDVQEMPATSFPACRLRRACCCCSRSTRLSA